MSSIRLLLKLCEQRTHAQDLEEAEGGDGFGLEKMCVVAAASSGSIGLQVGGGGLLRVVAVTKGGGAAEAGANESGLVAGWLCGVVWLS